MTNPTPIHHCAACQRDWREDELEQCGCCPPGWNTMYPCCYEKLNERPVDWEYQPWGDEPSTWRRGDGLIWRVGWDEWREDNKPNA